MRPLLSRVENTLHRSSPAERSPFSKGFTLLEIVFVVVLMGLIAAVAGPRVGSGLRGTETRTSVRRFAAALRAARTIAVTHQAQVLVVAELGGGTCEFRIRSAKNRRSSLAPEKTANHAEMTEHTNSGLTVSEIFDTPFELGGDVLFVNFDKADSEGRFERGVVMFLPQGNTTGGAFTLGRSGGPFFQVAVDAITGRVHVSRM